MSVSKARGSVRTIAHGTSVVRYFPKLQGRHLAHPAKGELYKHKGLQEVYLV
jgi:hypothetical protein